MQTVPDGAAYFNSIYRALPKNCSSDIQAVAKFFDEVFAGSDSTTALYIKTALHDPIGESTAIGEAPTLVPADAAKYMFLISSRLVQSQVVLVVQFRGYVITWRHSTWINIHQTCPFPAPTSGLAQACLNTTTAEENPRIRALQHPSGGPDSSYISLAAYLYGLWHYRIDTYLIEDEGDSFVDSMTFWGHALVGLAGPGGVWSRYEFQCQLAVAYGTWL